MKKSRVILFFTVLVAMALGSSAVAGSGALGTDTTTLMTTTSTTSQSAVFAAFMSNIPSEIVGTDVTTAISVSNVLAAPVGTLGDLFEEYGDTEGTVEFYLWDRDGTAYTYETSAGSPGIGLDADGKLGVGETYTVVLSELLREITGLPAAEIEFNGYGWVIGNFDAIGGTYNVTIFGVGFTQNFELMPGMGQGGYFGGIEVVGPDE